MLHRPDYLLTKLQQVVREVIKSPVCHIHGGTCCNNHLEVLRLHLGYFRIQSVRACLPHLLLLRLVKHHHAPVIALVAQRYLEQRQRVTPDQSNGVTGGDPKCDLKLIANRTIVVFGNVKPRDFGTSVSERLDILGEAFRQSGKFTFIIIREVVIGKL